MKSLALETQVLLEAQLLLDDVLLRLDMDSLEWSLGAREAPTVTVVDGRCDSAGEDSSTVAVAACTDTPITKVPSLSSITGRDRARDKRRGRKDPTARDRVWRAAILCTWVT